MLFCVPDGSRVHQVTLEKVELDQMCAAQATILSMRLESGTSTFVDAVVGIAAVMPLRVSRGRFRLHNGDARE
jgi:hypothetical protein